MWKCVMWSVPLTTLTFVSWCIVPRRHFTMLIDWCPHHWNCWISSLFYAVVTWTSFRYLCKYVIVMYIDVWPSIQYWLPLYCCASCMENMKCLAKLIFILSLNFMSPVDWILAKWCSIGGHTSSEGLISLKFLLMLYIHASPRTNPNSVFTSKVTFSKDKLQSLS